MAHGDDLETHLRAGITQARDEWLPSGGRRAEDPASPDGALPEGREVVSVQEIEGRRIHDRFVQQQASPRPGSEARPRKLDSHLAARLREVQDEFLIGRPNPGHKPPPRPPGSAP
ncbi:MAG: hypothetical protein VKP62_05455 [Candidatus Sericytochromatia bacterium]|nr:hypothetical protein [Candidatus Sericytochromatia bacterium]